jgi:pre-mRNA-splicing factor SYF2
MDKDKLQAQRDKLFSLAKKRQESIIENRKEISKTTKVESRKELEEKKEALQLLEKKHAKELNIDYERIQNSKYNIQQVQDWNAKISKKEDVEAGFTDFIQIQAKSYQKKINKLNMNQKLEEYQNSSNAEIKQDALDKLSKEITLVKKKKVNKGEDEDVSSINNRNAHFNKKLKRSYDKFTKEIRDNLERGTAL